MTEITSQFIFDIYVQKDKTVRKLTQIKITCPPDYGVAKVMTNHIMSQIIKDTDEIPIDDSKESAQIFAKLACFAYEEINTFEQNTIRRVVEKDVR